MAKIQDLPLQAAGLEASARLYAGIPDAGPTGFADAGVTWQAALQNIPVAPIVKPAAVETPALVFDYRGADEDSLPFRFTMLNSPNATDPRDNNVHRFGFNVGADGTPEDPTEVMICISMEEHWQNGSGDILAECHMEGVDNDGTAFRPFSYAFKKGDVDATLNASIQSNIITFTNRAGNAETFKLDTLTPYFGMALGGNRHFELLGDSTVGSYGTGLMRFYPYSDTNAGLSMKFASSLFMMGQENAGVPIAKMRFGPTALANAAGGFTVAKGASGSAVFGFGVDVGTGDADGDLHLLDGATINISGTATGLTIGGSTSDKVAFLGGTPVGVQDITGSTGGNAALQNLCALLANTGLFTDSTT